MAATHKKLGNGQLGATAGNLYAPGSTVTGMVKTVVLHNTDTVNRVATVYFNGSAAADEILNVTLSADETFEWSLGHMVVVDGTASPAETLKGKADSASQVNYFVFGAEE